jgi:D-glycero-D-manno-heptose 1,7-bisphosphate phosphatase
MAEAKTRPGLGDWGIADWGLGMPFRNGGGTLVRVVSPMQPAIFLDRDGVINRNRPDHVKSWSEFEFLPGALEALKRLAQAGVPVVIVSNQAAIGRGLVTREAVEAINRRMVDEIRAAGGRVDDVLFCPHGPEAGCDCRKPRAGLLLQAAERWGIDLEASVLVGDAESDILAAQCAGCHPLLVLTGRGAEQLRLLQASGRDGYTVVDDLPAAVEWIADFLER